MVTSKCSTCSASDVSHNTLHNEHNYVGSMIRVGDHQVTPLKFNDQGAM